MAKKVIRVGIAGYGRSGCDIHARWLREDTKRFQVVAVADQLPKRRADAKRDFGCAVHRDYGDLLARADVDLFINSLPSFLHPKGTIDGLNAGNHVVCEKPLARRVKDFDAMVAAARKAKKVLAPFQNSRFYPFFIKMREIIDSGVLGEIVNIDIAWSGYGRRWDWQTYQEMDGGNLLNTGPHGMDHAVLLFGKKQPKVFCRMKAIHPFGGDADNYTAATLYGGRHDPVVELVISSFQAYPTGDRYNVCGAYGGLTGGPAGLTWKYFDPKKAPKQKVWKPWSLDRRYCGEALPWVEKTWQPPKAKHDDFNANSRAFYNNVYDVLTNKGKLIVKPAEVRRQVIVMEECHRQNPLPRGKKK